MESGGKCPGLDIDRGIEQFGGNEELYFSILQYYLSDARTLLESMQNAGEDGLEDYARTAHSIKGASRNVFANDIGDAAEKLEHAAKDGDTAYIAEHNKEFLNDAWKLVHDIEGLIA